MLDSWWEQLSQHAQQKLHPVLEQAVLFDTLREQGRWLTVGYVNAFRRFLLATNSLHAQQVSEEQGFRGVFPSRLTNIVTLVSPSSPLGVSAGVAEGTLISRAQLQAPNARLPEDPILFVDMLTPDLAPYLPHLRGIIAERGGVLSHLAILAREQGVPVVTQVDFAQHKLCFGEHVRLDGSAASVTRPAIS